MDPETQKVKDKAEQKILKDINTYGWSIMNVFDPEHRTLGFAYSIGMYESLGSPEIIVFGMDENTVGSLLNKIGESIRSGNRLEANTSHHEFLEDGWPCTFVEVDKKYYSDYVGFAMWLYKSDDFPLLQCVWADEKGLYPWNKDFNPRVAHLQVLLNK